GGMAEVYLARAREDDGTVRHVVLKRVLTEMQHDRRMREMFLEEGRIASRLYHPNVCHVYDVGEANGIAYMVLEWVHGPSLRDVVRRLKQHNTALSPLLSAHIAAKIASALDYIHNARGIDGKPLAIIHQDVTPHNIMLSWKGQVKLLDFGIAKTLTSGASRTPQGKYEYMSPEQVRSQPIDWRSDIFALGVCLYEMLTGISPFERESVPQIMTAIVEENPPSLRSIRREIPELLERIVFKALAKHPEHRFRTAGEMQHALEEWITRNGGPVPDVRLALVIGSYFQAEEKAPLKPGAAQFTGTFGALVAGFESPIPQEEGEKVDGSVLDELPSTSSAPRSLRQRLIDRFFDMPPLFAFLWTLGAGSLLLALFVVVYLLWVR
ncbi:MAG: serine/threonine protein kinase, partial [Deltaproteobacteria bacterium]|nr:serine/threonine protein kinase [Deltaproteobacteria bacterium]